MCLVTYQNIGAIAPFNTFQFVTYQNVGANAPFNTFQFDTYQNIGANYPYNRNFNSKQYKNSLYTKKYQTIKGTILNN